MFYPLKIYQSLDSSSKTLKESENSNTPWFTIQAIEQKNGKGRYLRKWYSLPNKDLTFSTVIPVRKKTSSQISLIPLAIAVAISNVLTNKEIENKIKWPNDILINGSKVCGILVEGVCIGDQQSIIAGVGLNVNSSNRPPLTQPTTSLLQSTEKEWSLDELRDSIISEISSIIGKLEEGDSLYIINILRTRLAYLGEIRKISIDENRSIPARILGVNSEGHLLIEDETGKEELLSGEILFE